MEFEIALSGLRFHAFHGVLPEEKQLGNQFEVNLSVFIKNNLLIEEDILEGTISYVPLFEIVKKEMEIPRATLENLAFRIQKKVKEAFPNIIRGKVSIEKISPPIPGMIGSAKVTLNF